MAKKTARERANEERKNPPEEDPEFQIAPMIDILLVLMVFFMSISSTEVLSINQEIILPVAKDGKPASKNNPGQVIINVLWVPITEVGVIEIGERQYGSPAELVPRLQKAIEADPFARVLIRSDRDVRYEFIRTILQAVGQAGVQKVTFSVVDKEMAEKTEDAEG